MTTHEPVCGDCLRLALQALHKIHDVMNVEQWSPDTLDAIAEILEWAGMPITATDADDDTQEARA